MMSVRELAGAVAGTMLLLGGAAGAADEWPSRSIIAVSTVSAGNAGDTVARVVFEQLQKQLGQSLVIENRTGAGGVTGSASAAKAEPDGYTLLLQTSSQGSAIVLHKNLPYDPVNDFIPVAMFGIQPSVLVVSPEKGWNTVADLVKAAKANPGKLNFASAGVGSASHFAAAKLLIAAGIEAQHIPFRGAEGLNELIAGRIDFYFVPIAPAVPHIQNGRVRPLAVSTSKRAAMLPNVPTIGEAGYPTAQYIFWGGLALPAKTPRAIVNRLHDETEKALQVPEVKERLATLGVEPMLMSVDEYGKFVRDDIAAIVKFGKDINLTPTN
jgi:tripartite-type tricarboxylate transporter receptor subunit TctC